MARLSPQALVQLARKMVQQELQWKPTAEHAPPIPDGATTDDPMAEFASLDVRLLQQLGFRAYFDPATGQSAWPVPLGMTPHELYLFGKERGVLYESPVSGDILLQRPILGKEYVHAGLVMTVNGQGSMFNHTLHYETSTIEGDTDHRGFFGRGYTCKLYRRTNPSLGDRFLRWAELSMPEHSTEKVA